MREVVGTYVTHQPFSYRITTFGTFHRRLQDDANHLPRTHVSFSPHQDPASHPQISHTADSDNLRTH